MSGSDDRKQTGLLRLVSRFLAKPLPGQCLLHPLLLARLQIKGVSFDLLDDVFLLHLAFEAPQRVLQRLTFLNPHFRQTAPTPNSVLRLVMHTSCQTGIVAQILPDSQAKLECRDTPKAQRERSFVAWAVATFRRRDCRISLAQLHRLCNMISRLTSRQIDVRGRLTSRQIDVAA